VLALDSGAGLSNATLQQRLVPVRLFYDFLIEEGLRESNPVGRGSYTPGRRFGGGQGGRPLVPRMVKLPWIPAEAEWLRVLEVFRGEPARNRVMLALAYDAALRREELCSLRTDDLDPAHRMLRVRAQTTKTRRERMVPYSAPTGVLLSEYLRHRAALSRARGPLFLSESRRNLAARVRAASRPDGKILPLAPAQIDAATEAAATPAARLALALAAVHAAGPEPSAPSPSVTST
jgi:site-specific recombinase XerD